jgi:hypothetical protein
MALQPGMSYYGWKVRYESEGRKKYMTRRYSGKRLLALWHLPLSLVLALVFLVFSSTPLWVSTEGGSDNCVRKDGGQETFEWLCVDDGVVYLAKSENIIQCFSCFLKKFSDWTWEQEVRKGIRENPKYVTCRRYKRVKAKNGQQVCLYKGANNTYSLVVEGECPVEFRCKYDPHGQEPNIDSVVDSLNEKFK